MICLFSTLKVVERLSIEDHWIWIFYWHFCGRFTIAKQIADEMVSCSRTQTDRSEQERGRRKRKIPTFMTNLIMSNFCGVVFVQRLSDYERLFTISDRTHSKFMLIRNIKSNRQLSHRTHDVTQWVDGRYRWVYRVALIFTLNHVAHCEITSQWKCNFKSIASFSGATISVLIKNLMATVALCVLRRHYRQRSHLVINWFYCYRCREWPASWMTFEWKLPFVGQVLQGWLAARPIECQQQ